MIWQSVLVVLICYLFILIISFIYYLLMVSKDYHLCFAEKNKKRFLIACRVPWYSGMFRSDSGMIARCVRYPRHLKHQISLITPNYHYRNLYNFTIDNIIYSLHSHKNHWPVYWPIYLVTRNRCRPACGQQPCLCCCQLLQPLLPGIDLTVEPGRQRMHGGERCGVVCKPCC